MNATLAAVLTALALLTACGGGGVDRVDTPPPPPAGLAVLRVVCDPPDAGVAIDDAFAGVLAGYRDGRLAVVPGHHRLLLTHPGCASEYREVDLSPDGGQLQTHLVCPKSI